LDKQAAFLSCSRPASFIVREEDVRCERLYNEDHVPCTGRIYRIIDVHFAMQSLLAREKGAETGGEQIKAARSHL
jgi:hypothetical protein